MSKYKEGDIIVGYKDFDIKRPIVILGKHTFPDGSPAYRYRSCLPQYDLDSGDEIWSTHDGYNHQSVLDEYKLLWRRDETQ